MAIALPDSEAVVEALTLDPFPYSLWREEEGKSIRMTYGTPWGLLGGVRVGVRVRVRSEVTSRLFTPCP